MALDPKYLQKVLYVIFILLFAIPNYAYCMYDHRDMFFPLHVIVLLVVVIVSSRIFYTAFRFDSLTWGAIVIDVLIALHMMFVALDQPIVALVFICLLLLFNHLLYYKKPFAFVEKYLKTPNEDAEVKKELAVINNVNTACYHLLFLQLVVEFNNGDHLADGLGVTFISVCFIHACLRYFFDMSELYWGELVAASFLISSSVSILYNSLNIGLLVVAGVVYFVKRQKGKKETEPKEKEVEMNSISSGSVQKLRNQLVFYIDVQCACFFMLAPF